MKDPKKRLGWPDLSRHAFLTPPPALAPPPPPLRSESEGVVKGVGANGAVRQSVVHAHVERSASQSMMMQSVQHIMKKEDKIAPSTTEDVCMCVCVLHNRVAYLA